MKTNPDSTMPRSLVIFELIKHDAERRRTKELMNCIHKCVRNPAGVSRCQIMPTDVSEVIRRLAKHGINGRMVGYEGSGGLATVSMRIDGSA